MMGCSNGTEQMNKSLEKPVDNSLFIKKRKEEEQIEKQKENEEKKDVKQELRPLYILPVNNDPSQANYPNLDNINTNINRRNPRQENIIIQELDNEEISNRRRLPPIDRFQNLETAPIAISTKEEEEKKEEEEYSFDCLYTKEDLKKKIEEFLQEKRDQDLFYKQSSDDAIYNQLKNNEEQILKELFNSNKENFLEQIKDYYSQKFYQDFGFINFKNFSEKIINYENGEFYLINKIRKNILEIEEDIESFSVKHITILLVGKSGVGKSTLCNNLLRLPENKKALTDIGKPVTQASKMYSDPRVKFLKIIDTAGIEIHGEHKIENVIKTCKDSIELQVNSKDKNDMVSCIFYCFTGSRIEDEEVQFLDELRKSLEGNSIPILYVYTQAVRQSAINGMKECIEKERNTLGEVEFVPVLAEDYDLIDNKYLKSYGLDVILEKAVKTIKNNIKSNLFAVRTKEISDEIAQYFVNKNKKIKEFSIEKMYLHYLTNFDKVLDKDELVKFLLDIIEKCFIFFIEPTEVKNINKNSINEFKNTFQNYIEECYDFFDETASNIIIGFKKDQAYTFLNAQAILEKEGKNIEPRYKRELDDFLKIIDNYFRRNLIYIAEKAFINFFISDVYETICQKNEEYCNEIISLLIDEEKSIKESVNKCFITKYVNIEKNIAEYKIGYGENIYGRNYV